MDNFFFLIGKLSNDFSYFNLWCINRALSKIKQQPKPLLSFGKFEEYYLFFVLFCFSNPDLEKTCVQGYKVGFVFLEDSLIHFYSYIHA